MFVASDDATSGSVIAKADLVLPSNRGFKYLFFCSSVPYRTNTSMLPVSGAEQLNTSADHIALPIISHIGAYSAFVKP